MQQRNEFVLRALEPGANRSEFAREYEISRKTAYKWIRRFRGRGVLGLEDMSRRPRKSPLRASGEAVLEVLRLRQSIERGGQRSSMSSWHAFSSPISQFTASSSLRATSLTCPRVASSPTGATFSAVSQSSCFGGSSLRPSQRRHSGRCLRCEHTEPSFQAFGDRESCRPRRAVHLT